MKRMTSAQRKAYNNCEHLIELIACDSDDAHAKRDLRVIRALYACQFHIFANELQHAREVIEDVMTRDEINSLDEIEHSLFHLLFT